MDTTMSSESWTLAQLPRTVVFNERTETIFQRHSGGTRTTWTTANAVRWLHTVGFLFLLVLSHAAPTPLPGADITSVSHPPPSILLSSERNISMSSHRRGRLRRPAGQSPYDMGLRPSSSLDLPVLDIIEPPGKRYDPRPEDMDLRSLRAKIGRHFDHRFMSIKRPSEAVDQPNGTVDFPFRRNQRGRLVPLGTMPMELRKLDFKHLRLPDGSRLRTRVTRKLRRKLQQFLWAYTACPVVWKWRDLGGRFWPRWIKVGHCPVGHSCSIPPGMGCRPSRFENRVLLRWHCQDWDPTRVCKWIPIRYPSITACSCSCASGNSSL